MPNVTHFLDYSQPNSSARMEMLITIDYLLNEAYDEKHAAKQIDIVKYAEDNYGMYIRRDRISQILVHLEEIAQHNSNLLPFELGIVKLPATKKYYIRRRMFKDSEVVKIVSAIKSDSKLSIEETNKLCERFLSVAVNHNKTDAIKKKVLKRDERVEKLPQKVFKAQEAFLDAVERKGVLIFKLKTINKNVAFSKKMPTSIIVQQFVNEGVSGYAYKTYTINDDLYYVFYIPSKRVALLTKYDNVVFLKVYESVDDNIDFSIDNYELIDYWVEDHFTGKDGKLFEFKLKTTIGKKDEEPQKEFKSFKKAFEKYWKKDFEYEIVEREIPSKRIDANGNIYDDTIVALDAVFSIKSNINSFRNWYSNYAFDKAVILEPKHLNDTFLREKIMRYARRLTKYGERFNYEIIETFKPEYEEEIRKRKEMIEKRKKQISESNNKIDNIRS